MIWSHSGRNWNQPASGPEICSRTIRAVSGSIKVGSPCGHGEQLRLAGTLHRDEVPGGFGDGRTDGEQPVVAQDHRLGVTVTCHRTTVANDSVTQCDADPAAFLGVVHDSAVVGEQAVVVVEGATS